MKIDLTCPVELWQYAMPAEDASECTFVMNNLSDKVVTSIQVTLACFDREDMLLFRQTERIQGLKAGVGERFSIMLLPTQWRDVEGVDLIIEKVWFDDATIWRHGNAPLTQYTPNTLPNGRTLDQLRFVAGKDATGFPQVQDQVWLCVCGRANPIESQRCCRCERRRDAVFASFSQENVRQVIAVHEQKLAETARRAREDNSMLVEAQEKQRIAKRRRRRQAVKLGLSAACILAVAAVVIIWGIPTMRYNAALRLLRDGQYNDARAAFSQMGDYRSAEAQLVECDYQEAKASLNAGGREALLKAAAGFQALGDYSDSKSLWQQATYELGDIYLGAGSYENAAEMFQTLGDYEDSADKLRETTYRQADALLASGNDDVAMVLFGGLQGYKDSALKVQACLYAQGRALFDAGEYQQAAEKLSQLGEYENAPELVRQSSYQLAGEKFAQGDFEEAGNLYLQAGDYQDASARANDCLYQLAQEKKIAGDYEKAAELFLRITGYLDSEGQAQTCIYQQAIQKKDAGDYEGAAALLETVTGYDDAQRKLYECNYRMAMTALEAGDAARAEALLENVDNYEDSEKQLRIVRYQLAEEMLAQGNYEGALTRYNALGSYRDSVNKSKQCRYEIARAQMTAGKYAEAIEGFTGLGGYQDSKALLEEATYQLAMSYKTTGDSQEAIDLLKSMPENDQAAQELNDMTMAEAKRLEDAGDYAAAGAMYLALGDAPGARERYNACQYVIAQGLRQSGDLAGAGAAFLALGDYEDAAELGKRCYDEYYGAAAVPAREAMEKKDYLTVITALDGFSMTGLPESYQDLPGLYNEACYQYAEQLYRDGRPYEALPYYQRVGDYRDVADKKLSRRAYLVLGEWKSSTGKTATFKTDGTCNLMGETLFFRVSNFSLYTGTSANEMTITHKLSSIDKTSLSLRDVRDGRDVVYKFERVGDAKLPELTVAPAATPAPSPTAETDDLSDMLVTEE